MMKKKVLETVAEEGSLFHADVLSLHKEGGKKDHYVLLRVAFTDGSSGSKEGIMYFEECDPDPGVSDLDFLVGQNIMVRVLKTDSEGRLVCSRKEAQKVLLEKYREELLTGKELEGIVTGLNSYGGYVDVKGLTGKLKNVDFSADFTPLNECVHLGEKIRVRLKAMPGEELFKPLWELNEKFQSPSSFPCVLRAGEIVTGVILSCRNFPSGPAAFVRIRELNQKGSLDVLCAIPPDVEIYRNAGAVVRISSVTDPAGEHGKPRVRGRILRIL